MEITEIIDRYEIYKENKLTLSQQDIKNVFINPFLSELGYDLIDFFLIKSDYIINGYKIDYVILKDYNPFILIKAIEVDGDLLNEVEALRNAFNQDEDIDYAILTNGIEYWFFKEQKNEKSMDNVPFLKYNLKNSNKNSLDIIFTLFNPKGLYTINEKIDDLLYRDEVADFLKNKVFEVSPELTEFIAKSVGANISKELIESLFYSMMFDFSQDNELIDKIKEISLNDYINKEDELKRINSKKKLSITLKMFQNKPKIIEINNVEYRCNMWKEIFATFIEFIVDNYDIDLGLILSDKCIFKSFDDMPDYVKENPKSFKHLKNGLYLNTVISKHEFINKVNNIVLYLGKSPNCFKIEEIV